MDLGIRGRWAMVTASSDGLGLACARALASEGVNLVVNARDEDRLRGARDALAAIDEAVRVVAVVGAVELPATRVRLMEACPDPDILVMNNAGPPPLRLAEAGRTDWDSALAANLFARLELLQSVLPGMCSRGFGRVINLTSAMVVTPRPHMVLSAGARAALTAVMKGVSLEVARHNVTVNNLLPQRIDSGRQVEMAQATAVRKGISFDEARDRQASSVAAQRLGRPDEVGAACAFLASESAGFITGQNLRLDGGSYPGLI